MKHGTIHTYDYHGCRCEACRETNRIKVRDRKRKQREKMRGECYEVPPDAEHGTYSTYSNHGCRCKKCVAASRRYRNPYMSHKRIENDPREKPDHVHGTLNGYDYWRCKCERCKAVKYADNAERRARKRRQGVSA